MTIHLIGESFTADSKKWGKSVMVHSHTWDRMFAGMVPDPDMVMCFNTGVGCLELETMKKWLPRLVDLLTYPSDKAPTVVLTCRCNKEALGECAALNLLGAQKGFLTRAQIHHRNAFSGMAGDPAVQYDDNGWFNAFSGSHLSKTDLLALVKNPEQLRSDAENLRNAWDAEWKTATNPKEAEEETFKKNPAVFWGILDLKYKSDGPLEARVKVLETGDGRTSRFSGYGAAIKENFKEENKLEDTLRRAVLVENKKLTHDVVVDTGYPHLRPHQAFYPRDYTAKLAHQIRTNLKLEDDDVVVLKLPNRTRGAGVIPMKTSELDEALRVLLQPPKNFDTWIKDRDPMWARKITWGCFEEQLRHWWSNESPVFLVEEFCRSTPVLRDIGGANLVFDGTMRVGFTLHRAQSSEKNTT